MYGLRVIGKARVFLINFRFMVVMKFGGTSVADAVCIRRVADIVKAQVERRLVLVLSAMGDTTDHLLEAGALAYHEGRVSMGAIERAHLETKRALGLGAAEGEIVPLLEELRGLLSGISRIRELSRRTKDYLLSFGERLSVRIMAACLVSLGMRARGRKNTQYQPFRS